MQYSTSFLKRAISAALNNIKRFTNFLLYNIITWCIWEYDYVDQNLSLRMENSVYPLAVGVWHGNASYKNIELYGEIEEQALINERFIDYADCGHYGETNALKHSAAVVSGNNVIAENANGYKWVTAKKLVGNGNGWTAYAYMGAGKLVMRGCNSGVPAMVNLDIGNKKIGTITKVETEITPVGNSGSRPYLTMLMNEDESSYYLFGIGGRAVTDYDITTRPQYISEAYYTQSLAYNPDIVIIMLGANDVYEVTNAERSERFYEQYKSLVQSYKELSSNPEIYLAITTIDKWPTDNVTLYQSDKIRKVADELDVNLIDMRALITDKSLLSDSVHLGNVGYCTLAKEFSKALKSRFNEAYFDGDSFEFNSQFEILGDAYAASYKGGKLLSVVKKDGLFVSGTDYSVDLSALETADADEIKLFFMNDDLKPQGKVFMPIEDSCTVTDDYISVVANADTAGEDVVVALFDAHGEITGIDIAKVAEDRVYAAYISAFDTVDVYANGIKIN